MDGVQLCQGYKATMRRQYDFYQSVCRRFWYSLNQPGKDDRLSWPWIQPAVFNVGPLDWESNTLNTRSLLHNSPSTFCLVLFWDILLSLQFRSFCFPKVGGPQWKGVLVFHQKVAIKGGEGVIDWNGWKILEKWEFDWNGLLKFQLNWSIVCAIYAKNIYIQ